jgi:hypothetical protein
MSSPHVDRNKDLVIEYLLNGRISARALQQVSGAGGNNGVQQQEVQRERSAFEDE